MSAESLRQRLAAATPGPWIAPTDESEDHDVILLASLMPNFKEHIRHFVEADGEEYDQDCEGCGECGVNEDGSSADNLLLACGRQDLEALLAFVDQYDRWQSEGPSAALFDAMITARRVIEMLP